ncbi:hypothetical protein AYI68_g6031 [Smittium mucronatum]|uniref:PA14 domain-containing protein n=1 Tax=Smittium mucronatum TaxID=133383 RepID=A0A1R0GSS1_9FUNG|nr:hypothetical protein AYI68_g6031 [Smittium mucronatum]
MKFMKNFFNLGTVVFLVIQALTTEGNNQDAKTADNPVNSFHGDLDGSLLENQARKRQSYGVCDFSLGNKTIEIPFENPSDFFNNTDAPLVIPCNGNSFRIQYEADKINSHYFWIVESNDPLRENGVQFVLDITNNCVKSGYYEQSADFESLYSDRTGYYNIEILSNSDGLRIFKDGSLVASFSSADLGHEKYFTSGPKYLYLGGKAKGQILSNIIVSCTNGDSTCLLTSSSYEKITPTIDITSEETSTESNTMETMDCAFPKTQKIINKAFKNSYEFYSNIDSPIVIPCNGYSFSVEYLADQINNHYLWITDSKGPLLDRGFKFEMDIDEGVPSIFFGLKLGLESIAFGQDENYKIKITSDESGILIYINNYNVANIAASSKDYKKYFSNGPKNLYLGGSKVGQVISNIIITCSDYDSSCPSPSPSYTLGYSIYTTTGSVNPIETTTTETISEDSSDESCVGFKTSYVKYVYSPKGKINYDDPILIPCCKSNFVLTFDATTQSDVSVAFTTSEGIYSPLGIIEAISGVVSGRSSIRRGSYNLDNVSLSKRQNLYIQGLVQIYYQNSVMTTYVNFTKAASYKVSNYDFNQLYIAPLIYNSTILYAITCL